MSRIWQRGAAVAAITLAMVTALSCGDDEQSAAPTARPTSQSSAAGSTPAEPRNTPASGADVVENAYTTERVHPAVDFERIVDLRVIPGDEEHAVAVSQGGEVHRFSLTAPEEEPTLFLDVSDDLIDSPGTEEGLLGLAFAPDFAESGRYYIYYSAGPPRQTMLERVTVGEGGDVRERILEVDDPYGNHNGGGLHFGPDGMLYLAIGDGGSSGDPHDNGQNTTTLLGKILRLDVSGDGGYATPDDNPFVAGGGQPEIYAYGFRNPWRFSFDRDTGDLWAGDVGQGTREEIDLVVSGGNYGWSIVEGDLCFKPREGCSTDGLIAPRAVYGTHEDGNCSVTGGHVYRGKALPELFGWYVYGDYCSGIVWALPVDDDSVEPVRIAETGHQISSFAEDAEGELLLLTFDAGVQRLVRH